MLVNLSGRWGVLCWGPKICSLFHSYFPGGCAQVLWEHGITDGWNAELQTQRIISIRASVINSSAQENMEHRLSWKKTGLQPIHQGRTLFNRTFVRPGQVLPQLPELQGSGLQIFFSYLLQGPCWSLVDLVLSFHYSPYHSSTHLLQLPPLWTTNFFC